MLSPETLAPRGRSVVCCRVSPKQKADVVDLVSWQTGSSGLYGVQVLSLIRSFRVCLLFFSGGQRGGGGG